MANFPSGTKTIFNQTNAPTGWTKITTYDDCALRIVSGNASTGGTQNFSSVHNTHSTSGSIQADSATGITVLSTTQIPSHTHSYDAWVQQPHTPTGTTRPFSRVPFPARTTVQGGGLAYFGSGDWPPGNLGHSHPYGTFTFTGNSININVNYIDVIIASKD